MKLACACNIYPVHKVTYSLEICSTFPRVYKLTNQKYLCVCGHINLVQTFPCKVNVPKMEHFLLWNTKLLRIITITNLTLVKKYTCMDNFKFLLVTYSQ